MCHIPDSMCKAQAEWNLPLLAATWGTLCQRMLDVLNTPGYNKQSHNVNPILGWCLQRNHRQLGQSLGVIFAGWPCRGVLYSQVLEESRGLPGPPCLSLGSSALQQLQELSCPWAAPFPPCDTSCAARNSSGSAAGPSHFLVSVWARQGRMETWKMSLHSWEAQSFGSSTTAGCLQKQIPHLVITFRVQQCK